MLYYLQYTEHENDDGELMDQRYASLFVPIIKILIYYKLISISSPFLPPLACCQAP